jgi:hypothetical protein
LKQAIDSYRYGGDFHADITPNAVSGDVEVTLRVIVPPPLDEWSLLFGDCVHNIRAALDHLAWELDSAPEKSTTFPTFTANPLRWPPPAVSRMPAPAQTIVEAVRRTTS